MSQIKEDVLRFFRDGDALSRLIAYLLGTFVLILVLRILSQFSMVPIYSVVMPYFTLPADLSELLFKPWTLFSYMFVHEGFTHILFNLLYLYFAGQISGSTMAQHPGMAHDDWGASKQRPRTFPRRDGAYAKTL